MTNHKEVLTAAIEKAREGLGMWGWDAAATALLSSGIRVELVPIDQESYPRLKLFRVDVRANLWNRKGPDPGDADVLSGSCYGDSIEEAFLGSLADLEQMVQSAGDIVTDREIWP